LEENGCLSAEFVASDSTFLFFPLNDNKLRPIRQTRKTKNTNQHQYNESKVLKAMQNARSEEVKKRLIDLLEVANRKLVTQIFFVTH